MQHIQYVPFGEVFVEERNATWSTPYKFNGKEQDEETGLCYYGARYYDPRTSVWLSVDPLAEKKPFISSYVYCRNNPINMIDPDGRDEVYDRQGNFIEKNNHVIDDKKDHLVIRDQNYLKKALVSIGLGNTKMVKNMSDNIDTRIEKTTLSAKAYSNVFTNILTETNGVKMGNLYKGAVSVIVSHNDYNIDDEFNSPCQDAGQNASSGTVDDQTRITASIINSGDKDDNRFLFSTSSNVQNLLGAHEKIGHGQKGWGDATRTHHKVYEYQFKHDSWKNTTQPFKDDMKTIYQKYIYPTKK